MNDKDYFIDILNNPLLWCETFLRNPDDPNESLKLRSYQAELLNETKYNDYMSIRYGRRLGKSVGLCCDALWWSVAQPFLKMFKENKTKVRPFKVLVVAPMDSQITMLFDTIISLCMDSPFIQQLEPKIVRSDVSKVTFSNGCTITGKTIAISSGNKGVKLRGDSADYVLVDEVDYIPDDVFEKALLPIITTNEYIKI